MQTPTKKQLVSVLFLLTLTLLMLFTTKNNTFSVAVSEIFEGKTSQEKPYDKQIVNNAETLLQEGRQTFRYDTFGDEAFWGDTLKLHQAILGTKSGGIGEGVSPELALKVGLKVDIEAIPPAVIKKFKNGEINLRDPITTVELLKHDAILGLKGCFDTSGKLTSIGITCAICHSTVDDSYAQSIGKRLDGWANRDLNIGAIVALSPNLKVFSELLDVDEAIVRKVLLSWGPGKYDALLNMDGKAFRPDGKTSAVLIPPAYGLAGVNLHTSTGWGSVPYWNAYVANTQMHGKGTFFDPRLNNKSKYPIATKAKYYDIKTKPDLITPKLAALHFYQLSLPAPQAPAESYSLEKAERGKLLFSGKAKCANCHVPPLYTEPGYNLHTPARIGIDSFQADRSPTERYRTSPLRGLWAHQKGGFYHDGRFATLEDVIEHYNKIYKLQLTKEEKLDLVEFLKSI